MKNMLVAILFICAVLLFAGCLSEGEIEQARIDLVGMVCVSCEVDNTFALEAAGVTVLDISASEGFAEVEFDTSEISLEDVKRILERNGLMVQ